MLYGYKTIIGFITTIISDHTFFLCGHQFTRLTLSRIFGQIWHELRWSKYTCFAWVLNPVSARYAIMRVPWNPSTLHSCRKKCLRLVGKPVMVNIWFIINLFSKFHLPIPGRSTCPWIHTSRCCHTNRSITSQLIPRCMCWYTSRGLHFHFGNLLYSTSLWIDGNYFKTNTTVYYMVVRI